MTQRYQPASLAPAFTLKPEVLAPAGDYDSLIAALSSGADAVFFGLSDGFNARARAENFTLKNLPEIVALIHRSGARAYLTLNTLIFSKELDHVERVIRRAAEGGIDALIVQDPAVALIAKKLCPEMELHASTQMTISSPEGARFAKTLGMQRIVLPRELSILEIEKFSQECSMELEVFVHGALCVSWSGQCLTSRAWGGRSANRGQCAQSCRLPYTLIVDGVVRDLGDVQYLLSPKDLSGMRAIPGLIQAGVHTLKIEGRQKGPAYVSTAVSGMRNWVDALCKLNGATSTDQEVMSEGLRAMRLSYSRGFTDGFFAGSDHQSLVEGKTPRHRGIFLGKVLEITDDSIRVKLSPEEMAYAEGKISSPLPLVGGGEDSNAAPAAPLSLRAGMGVVFEDGEPERQKEPGGSLFDVHQEADGVQRLRFKRGHIDLSKIEVGRSVWVTSDPVLQRSVRKLVKAGPPSGRIPVSIEVIGDEGKPLKVKARSGRMKAFVQSEQLLTASRGAGLSEEVLIAKLGALGGTPFHLDGCHLGGFGLGLHFPVSILKKMRRTLVDQLLEQLNSTPREIPPAHVWRGLLDNLVLPEPLPEQAPELIVLCRTDAQLDAAITAGVRAVELDWMEMVGLAKAVKKARAADLHVTLATVRIQKPGEEVYNRVIERMKPDAVLLRHWGGLMHFAQGTLSDPPELHGDFSLNVTNPLSAAHLFSLGLDTITASHDLDEAQLMALLDVVPPSRVTVVVHHHISTFHTEHCVYAHTLSEGRDSKSCGRPCDRHEIRLRDHNGKEHPVITDVECRNTIFNAQAQSAPSLVPALIKRGVRRFRVAFVRESQPEALLVLQSFQALLAGEIDATTLVKKVGAHEQFGVTQGTMKTIW